MRFNDFTPQVLAKVRAVEEQAVRVTTLVFLEESNRTIPIEEGTMERSGDTDVEVQATRVVGVAGYNTKYVRRQHEDTTMRHDPGRRAKWLELTGIEQGERLVEVMGQQMAAGMGGP